MREEDCANIIHIMCKKLPILLTLFLFISCSTNEYWQFHDQKAKITEQQANVEVYILTEKRTR